MYDIILRYTSICCMCIVFCLMAAHVLIIVLSIILSIVKIKFRYGPKRKTLTRFGKRCNDVNL